MAPTTDYSIINVRHNVDAYMESEDGRGDSRQPDDRFASFDYCFNYFQSFRDQGRIDDICHPDNIQCSCLHIGFYLASWGMLRGNTFLLKKSARFYKRLVQTIVDFDRDLWDVDADSYTEHNIDLLLGAVGVIRKAVSSDKEASDTLVTKIMLGVFGNIPAFDSYFCKGLRVWEVNKKGLQRVAGFYDCHKSVIDECANTIHTLDFMTGQDTDRLYTKAKIVDMVGFMAGAE